MTAARKPRKKQLAPPAGLAHAFKLIDLDSHSATAASSHAKKAYPHAMALLGLLHELDNDEEFPALLLRASEDLFESSEDPDCIAEGSFMVGFATCWLLMTQVNGGGAR